MKIAYIVRDFGLLSETFVTDLALGLANVGEQITILCNNCTKETPDVFCIEKINFLTPSSVIDRIKFALNKFFGKQKESQIFEQYLKHAYKQLLPALKKHQPDVAYLDFGTVAVLARNALKKLNIPFVVHFHGSDISSALNDAAYREELQKVFQDASGLIVASNHIRRLLVLEGAPPEKIQLIRLGINLEGLVPKPWNQRKNEAPSIVFLGRFTPKKNPVALVEAFAIVKQVIPEAKLSMIGDGTEMPRVKQRIEQLGLTQEVKLYGALPRHQALPILNQHWVFAQHSVTASSGDQEGFGISLAEAAALELPVVSTLHNGIPEQVINGKTGLLVREFDYETMAEYIIKLLKNPDLAEEMGKAGRENISQMCQIERRVDGILEILASVSNSRETVT